MAGLNHESTANVGDDLAIDLEVTSNRPDCLGHLGVAREVAVLWDQALRLPEPQPSQAGPPIGELTEVSIRCPELCHRYTARVIRYVKIGPSPDWLVERLASIGLATVNNVVDITNLVMMENGQPLHAFDLAKLAGPEIIVREALPGEQFQAINHREYTLEPGMCVIADAERAVALGGVMGGADTEVSPTTTELLIEAADFAPLSIRTTARKLNLHSPSSYRFERGVDPEGVDWASRRCCQWILELAGGTLAAGSLDVGQPDPARTPIILRLSQLSRVLGIDIPNAEVQRILTALGCLAEPSDDASLKVVSPSWRRDLTREIDLVEEVARIYGYDRIPEDAAVPMAPSHRSDADRVLGAVRGVMLAAGFDEALTASAVSEEWAAAFRPWSDHPPLVASTAMLKGADRLRCSLVPSLLEVRRINESLSNPVIELFETARIYLPQDKGLPREQSTLTMTSGEGFARVKGALEGILETLHIEQPLETSETRQSLLDPTRSAQLQLGGRRLGFIGEISAEGLKSFGLRAPATIAEIDLDVLLEFAELVPKFRELSPYPAIERDINLIVNEAIRWADLAGTIRRSAGEYLESVQYQETYRDPQKDGGDKKRLLFNMTLRSGQRTLTNEEADEIRQRVVEACSREQGAVLLGG
jgi:phenylalanyl-tRNA synthetase beta chain